MHFFFILTLLHSERPKLYEVLAVLSATELKTVPIAIPYPGPRCSKLMTSKMNETLADIFKCIVRKNSAILLLFFFCPLFLFLQKNI